MLMDASESQLVLVDYQEKLKSAVFESSATIANAVRLARVAAMLQVPVLATEQNPDSLGPTVGELRGLSKPPLAKTHFSAVQDGLVELLRPPVRTPSGNARSLPKHLQKPVSPAASERTTILLAGWEAHVCLLQTALDLVEEEFDVCVVSDACSSRTERNRDAAFDRLAAAGVELVSSEMVIFEWLRHCEHARFKDVLALVK
jgi:nicotinamidase-related amidase